MLRRYRQPHRPIQLDRRTLTRTDRQPANRLTKQTSDRVGSVSRCRYTVRHHTITGVGFEQHRPNLGASHQPQRRFQIVIIDIVGP
jgi:hypothetical protein